MEYRTRAVTKVAFLIGTMGVGAQAFAASSASQTATVTTFATGGQQTALISGVITMTGSQTASAIGSTVGSIVGAASAGVGPTVVGVNRFALPGQGTGAAAAPGAPKWNGWFSLSRNNIAYNFAPLQSSGHADVGIIGVDYTFGNNVVAGVAFNADRSDIDLTFTAGKLKAKGWGITPYIGVPLNKSWTFDGSVGFGKTKLDLDMGALGNNLTSRIDDKRQTMTMGLSYRRSEGNWFLTGRGAILDVKDGLSASTLSNGVANVASPSATARVQQARLGGEAAYSAGLVTPFAGLNYIYDIKKPLQVTSGGQTSAGDRDAFQATLGLRFRSTGALYGSVQYSTEQGRAQIKNDQLMLNLGLRF